MLNRNPIVRRIVRALAAVQLLAFAAAPLMEAVSVEGIQRPSVVAPDAHVQGLGSAHDPATCPACQILRVSARPTEPASITLLDVGAPLRPEFEDLAAPAQVPRHGFQSRAPPSSLV